MQKIWLLFYNIIFIPVFSIVLRLAGLFNSKVRKGLRDRKRIFENLILDAAAIDKTKKMIWLHSSSLGEFEQAKPIIEELKKRKDINILVTFFSPSGYENSKRYPFADLVAYIPFDTVSNAGKFISIIKPDIAIIMRYDIWPNHIWAMKKADVPVLLVDATMKEKSPRKFPLIRSFHENLFRDITHILTVSEKDAKGFKEFGCNDKQIRVVGDTRFDRVHQKSITAKESRLINKEFLEGKKIIVAGSTWPSDEEIILPAFVKLTRYLDNVLLIIAPHEPTLINLENLENDLRRHMRTIRFSFLNNYRDEAVIIVDSIGILMTLYSYADVAFIGGGFKHNVHNVLEAAVYGVPVLFGPKIENSQEAYELIKTGGGVMVKNRKDAYRQLRTLLSDDNLRRSKAENSFNYVEKNTGATEKIISEINRLL